MEKIFERINDFLFDLLGLFLPGCIALLLGLLPFALLDASSLNSQGLAGWLINKYSQLFSITAKHSGFSLAAFIIAAYLLGHVIKVFSKLQYDLFEALLDDCLWKWGGLWLYWFRPIRQLVGWLKSTPPFNVGVKLTREIFSFRRLDYKPDMETLYQRSRDLIRKHYDEAFQTDWYGFYKFADAMAQQEGLQSKTYTFLAKYNFYRSVAFLFLLNFFYLWWLVATFGDALPSHFATTATVANFLCWFTFHEKYKRYWSLCGNETIAMVYYHLSKPTKTDSQTH